MKFMLTATLKLTSVLMLASTLALASTLMIAHLDLNLSDNLFKQQLGRINLSQSCYSKLKGLYDGRRGLRVCVFIPRFPPEGPNFGWAV